MLTVLFSTNAQSQLDIAYDGFVRTTDARHEALVAEVLQRVWDKVRSCFHGGLVELQFGTCGCCCAYWVRQSAVVLLWFC